jgi:tyrosine-protein kinase Etk/Wzc
VQSESVANNLITRFGLQERYEKEYLFETRKTLDQNTKVTTGKDGLISVSVDDHDPQVAANIANAYVTELGALLQRLAITEAQQRRVFFEKHLLQTKNQLTKAEQALADSGVNSAAMKSSPEASIKAVAEIQARIFAQEVRISSMRGYLAASSPELKLALGELSALRNQFAKIEANSGERVRSSSDADYVARIRDVKYFETLFELFARQYELARADEAREGTTIQVVDVALPPERKSKPKRAVVAVLATLGSGFLMLIFVFARQALRNAGQDPGAAQKLTQIRTAWRRSLGKV